LLGTSHKKVYKMSFSHLNSLIWDGYEIVIEQGKPLSAYKFAEANSTNDELHVTRCLEKIVSGAFANEWNRK
jgi:hypothetical protein